MNTKKELEKEYAKLIQQSNVEKLSNEAILKNLGMIIDISLDLEKKDGINHAIFIGQRLIKKGNLTSIQKSVLHFYLANAHANLRQINNEDDKFWQIKEIEEEIRHLRQALFNDKTDELPIALSCPILTNLGNLLSSCGRRIEAIDFYDRALEKNSQFSMARGNKGLCFFFYALMLYDKGHIAHLIKASYKELQQALTNSLDDENAKRIFSKWIEIIKSHYQEEFLESELNFKEFSLGFSKKEKNYRIWVLRNKLFLNPLNDIGPFSIAATDILHVPSIVAKIEEPPIYQGFYNQIKQEFVSARFLCYEGLFDKEKHYSDRNVMLYDTLDYPDYSLKAEKIKYAYRSLYSIFDKISFFLNDYFQLGIPEKRVYFKSIWYSDNDPKVIRKIFFERDNPAITALFWLSRDLFDDISGISSSIEPEARELYLIRNHLEHKYFKLHHPMWHGKPSDDNCHSDPFYDTWAFSITRPDFENKTIKLLKLVRSALVYLSSAIRFEEEHRAKQRDKNKLIVPWPYLPHYRK